MIYLQIKLLSTGKLKKKNLANVDSFQELMAEESPITNYLPG
jgi:hypothetical protein